MGRRFSVLVALALASPLIGMAGCCQEKGPIYGSTFQLASGTFAVIGDTQRTLPIERLLGREQNDAERPRLIDAIAKDRPDLLVHLGDAVADGASARSWRYFDQL